MEEPRQDQTNDEDVPPDPDCTSDDACSGLETDDPDDHSYSRNIQRILDIHLPVTVSFGTTTLTLNEVLKLAPGSLLELDRSSDDPVLLKVNDKAFAWGRVVDVDGYYGVEITDILNRSDRIASLGGEV
ncbi:MAG: FliM/FliN family flagellar motor switch protein [Acidobacteriota bacterium]